MEGCGVWLEKLRYGLIHKKVGVSQMRLPAVGRECGIRKMAKAESLKPGLRQKYGQI